MALELRLVKTATDSRMGRRLAREARWLRERSPGGGRLLEAFGKALGMDAGLIVKEN
jgi:hypothetical protein